MYEHQSNDLFRLSPQHILTRPDGEQMTYKDYYKETHRVEVTDMYQPLLINRPKKRQQRRAAGSDHTYLIPEFCNLTGLDEKTRKDFAVMRDLAVHTRKSPMQRANELKKFINYMHGRGECTPSMNPQASVEYMKKWRLTIDENKSQTELFNVEGRELPPEPLIMRNGQNVDVDGRGKVYEITGSREGDWDRTAKGKVTKSPSFFVPFSMRIDCILLIRSVIA